MPICPECNKEFLPNKYNDKIYCSKKCLKNHWKKNPYKTLKIICVICKNDFKTNKPNQIYCSKKCLKKHLNITRQNKYRNTHPLLTLICPICNKQFIQSRNDQKCCSKKCNSTHYNKTHKFKYRETRLGTTKNGICIKITVNKRHYPTNEKCELCGTSRKNLTYHHWLIKNGKAYGLWICRGKCHWLVEVIDDNLIKLFRNKYLKLKKKINNEF